MTTATVLRRSVSFGCVTWATMNGSPASAKSSMMGSASFVVAPDFLRHVPIDRTIVRAWLPDAPKENCSGLGLSGQTAAMPSASGGHGCRTPPRNAGADGDAGHTSQAMASPEQSHLEDQRAAGRARRR